MAWRGRAPVMFRTSSPSLNSPIIGMPITPYRAATSGVSSTLVFTNLMRPPYCSARASTSGDTMRHGPHHGAQKSTTTGSEAASTSSAKAVSVSATIKLMPVPTAARRGVFRARRGAAGQARRAHVQG